MSGITTRKSTILNTPTHIDTYICMRPKWDTTESHRQTCYLIWLPSFWLYKPCQSIFQQLHYALLQHTPYRTLIVRVLATGLSSPYCHITPRLGDAPLACMLTLSMYIHVHVNTYLHKHGRNHMSKEKILCCHGIAVPCILLCCSLRIWWKPMGAGILDNLGSLEQHPLVPKSESLLSLMPYHNITYWVRLTKEAIRVRVFQVAHLRATV